ncbi:hypothetical protein KI387_024256, partial [Taxus chinensis]
KYPQLNIEACFKLAALHYSACKLNDLNPIHNHKSAYLYLCDGFSLTLKALIVSPQSIHGVSYAQKVHVVAYVIVLGVNAP